MLCTLKSLKPNPRRDFIVDPVDEDVVEELRQSIKADGFWGGVVCRKNNDGDLEVAAGWHRVKAAIKAGVKEADLFVADEMDDGRMIRVYARENATQRGTVSTALAGTVASAVKYLAKDIMTGVSRDFTEHVLKIAKGQIATEKGLGADLIVQFLNRGKQDESIRGYNQNIVKQQIAILKESGDYKRIISEVQAEIEAENAEATKTAEKNHTEPPEAVTTARAASNSANRRDTTFDYHGTAKYLKNPSHVETFRKAVTGKGVQPYLPIKMQKALAAEIAKRAEDKEVELTSSFIKENIGTMIHRVVVEQKRIKKEEEERMLAEDWERRFKDLQHNIARQFGAAFVGTKKLVDELKEQPKGSVAEVTAEFRSAVKNAKALIKLIETKVL